MAIAGIAPSLALRVGADSAFSGDPPRDGDCRQKLLGEEIRPKRRKRPIKVVTGLTAIPNIAASSFAMTVAEEKARAVGCDGVTKPFGPVQLRIIRGVLSLP
jgi:hypothetical protein